MTDATNFDQTQPPILGLCIQPMLWTGLADLSDVPELDTGDLGCLLEIRKILTQHGKLKRFAIHLAHRHFAMDEDEILIERQDEQGRAQTISVGRRADTTDARPTTWLFGEGETLNMNAAVYCVCVGDPNKTEGCVRHGKSRSPIERVQKEDSVRQRRISEENARYEQGFPVAGHDWDKGGGRGR